MKPTRIFAGVFCLLLGLAVLNVRAETFIASHDLAGTDRNDFTGTVGFEFTIGPADRTVDSLGFYDKGDNGLSCSHQVGIWNAIGTLIGSTTVQAGTASVLMDGFRYEPVAGGPITLHAQQTYRVGAEVFNGGDIWPDIATAEINPYYIGTNEFYGRWVSGDFADPVQGGGDDTWYEGKAYGAPNIRPLTIAHNPLPHNIQTLRTGIPTGVAIEVTLAWETGLSPDNLNQVNDQIESHLLYIAPNSPDFTSVEPVEILAGEPTPDANSTFTVMGLDPNTLYYWRVDELVSANGEPELRQGNVWSFVTIELPTVAGDLNYDFTVNLYDLARLAGAWLCTEGAGCFDEASDINKNGGVDEGDLAVMTRHWLESNVETQIDVNPTDIKHQISEYLTGVCVNAAYDTDDRWADGTIATRLVEMDANILRFPDTAAMYHWQQCPGAPAWKDSWETDPNSFYYFDDHTICDSNHTMDVDDYIYWCNQVGAEPYITVNFQSGWRYDRLDDSLDEAVALIQHCSDNNYQVSYWRIGNEPFDLTPAEMASVVNTFAPAMKAVDPNIKIIFNVANEFSTSWARDRWDEFFALAGHNVDYADLHCYWRWTNESQPDEDRATWVNFLSDNPITHEYKDWQQHYTYDENIKNFRQRYQQYGIDVVITEWNAGPVYGLVERSHFQVAMMTSEMMMQFIKGNLLIATRWPGSWSDPRGWREFIDPVTFQPNPEHAAMVLFSNAMGQNLVSSTSSELKMPCISVRSTDGQTLWLYVLNKTGSNKSTRINACLEVANAEAVALIACDGDVWSDDYSLAEQQTGWSEQSVYVDVPAYSLTLVTMHAAETM